MVLLCRFSNTACWLSVMRFLIQACPSKLKVLIHPHLCSLVWSSYLWNWSDLQIWKSTCSNRPQTCGFSQLQSSSGISTYGAMHIGGSTGLLTSWSFKDLYTCGVLKIYILIISCVHMLSNHPVDPHMCILHNIFLHVSTWIWSPMGLCRFRHEN